MKLKVDIEQLFKSFFELRDWKDRVLFFTGLQIFNFFALIVLFGIAMFAFLIPVVGAALGCMLYALAMAGSALIPLYLAGYRLDLSEAIMEGRELQSVKVSANYGGRIKEGFKIMLANLLYSLPALLPFLLIMTVLIVAMAAAQNGSDVAAVVAGMSMLVWMLLIFVVVMAMFFVQLFILPAIQIHYLVHKRQLASVTDFSAIWVLAKKYVWDFLLFGLLMFGVAMIMGFVLELTFFLIFVLIGLLIFPLMLGFYTAYLSHLQAELVGQLAAHESKR